LRGTVFCAEAIPKHRFGYRFAMIAPHGGGDCFAKTATQKLPCHCEAKPKQSPPSNKGTASSQNALLAVTHSGVSAPYGWRDAPWKTRNDKCNNAQLAATATRWGKGITLPPPATFRGKRISSRTGSPAVRSAQAAHWRGSLIGAILAAQAALRKAILGG
jgi:hypothetical protein